MDRLFLDANILFSAAYRPGAGLLELWRRKDVVLCSSSYAIAEARVNLESAEQIGRLNILARSLDLSSPGLQEVPHGISLPEKDVPILLAAMAAQATHLLTGDLRHFGRYYGRKIAGILVLSPGAYLRSRE